MKTEQEILDFYEIKKDTFYKIEDASFGYRYFKVNNDQVDQLLLYRDTEDDKHTGTAIISLLNNVEYCEYKKPILDKKEREYLSAVIKPFKKRIDSIAKKNYRDKYEYISIVIKGDVPIEFPKFNKNTMYKDMKLGKHYTLEELDL